MQGLRLRAPHLAKVAGLFQGPQPLSMTMAMTTLRQSSSPPDTTPAPPTKLVAMHKISLPQCRKWRSRGRQTKRNFQDWAPGLWILDAGLWFLDSGSKSRSRSPLVKNDNQLRSSSKGFIQLGSYGNWYSMRRKLDVHGPIESYKAKNFSKITKLFNTYWK